MKLQEQLSTASKPRATLATPVNTEENVAVGHLCLNLAGGGQFTFWFGVNIFLAMCILCNILLTCCNKIHLEIQSWFVVMCVRRFFLHTFHFICHLVFVESIHHPLGGLHSGSLVSSFQYTESSEVFLISSFVASPYSAFFIPCLCFASTFLFPFHTILTTKLALSQVSW